MAIYNINKSINNINQWLLRLIFIYYYLINFQKVTLVCYFRTEIVRK